MPEADLTKTRPEAGRPASAIPDASEVRQVLSAIRYGQSLASSPLVELEAVRLILLREGVAPGLRGRAWALGLLIQEIVEGQLKQARLAAGMTGESERETERDHALRLESDFAAGSPELENWSALYHRYLDASQLRSGDIADLVGMSRRTLGRRMKMACQKLADVLASRDREAARNLAARTDLPLTEQIEFRPALVPDETQAPSEILLETVRGAGGMRASFAPESLERLADERPRDLTAYRLSRVAAWSRPAYQVGARFVNLTLLLDHGEGANERWKARDGSYKELGRVLEAVEAPAVVLLGSPGSGKSTLLRRFELDLSVAGLRGETDALPFLVSLGQYWADGPGANTQVPAAWLAKSWRLRYPDLPSFDQLLEDRRLVLLLDGLNEMPHSGLDEYRERILAWKRFLHETVAEHAGVRVVFACRSLDYGAPLSSPEQRVPQVRVEAMTDAQVRLFLRRYAPAQADALWASLEGLPQLEILRSPYLLTLLIEQAIASGEAPIGRAALFTSFVRRALRREIERDNPLFKPGQLLDERDYRRAISGQRWATPWSLPDRGVLMPGLTRLAHGMQARYAKGRASQVRVDFDTALDLLDHPAAEDIVRAGEALAVLDEHRGRDEVLFFHQLQQEYFAARGLSSQPEEAAERVACELRAAKVKPSVAEVVAGLDVTEPLPPLPSTGWEEIVLMAASMSEAPEDFIEAIEKTRPPLAGLAAAQPELADRLSDTASSRLRSQLIEMGRDEDLDLRARIEAGLALGLLGDPRFETAEGPHGSYFRPPMVHVPAGEYQIGVNPDEVEVVVDPDDGRAFASYPRHSLQLSAFEIGRFPVINAEWSCFMASGGYEDERWWVGPDAKAWQRGDLTAEGSRRWVRNWLKMMRDEPGLVDTFQAQGMSPEQEAMWHARLKMDEAELQQHLETKYPQRRYTRPYHESRSLHAAPTQPVSGICWYEARAYCAWLSAQTGQVYRLPTEVEWEAAARGGDARSYPWGDTLLDMACNVNESHLRRTAPVGVMPGGTAPCGAEMMCGDVGDWTLSLWGPDAQTSSFVYPYRADDGREQVDAAPTVHRVQRGGSFLDSALQSRTFARNALPPDTRFHGFGMRLLRELDEG